MYLCAFDTQSGAVSSAVCILVPRRGVKILVYEINDKQYFMPEQVNVPRW